MGDKQKDTQAQRERERERERRGEGGKEKKRKEKRGGKVKICEIFARTLVASIESAPITHCPQLLLVEGSIESLREQRLS